MGAGMESIEALDDDALLRRIEWLQVDSAQAIDDGGLESWPDFFVDPCFYRIVARDNFERGLPIGVMRYESVAMLRDQVTATLHAGVYAPRTVRHILGGTRLVGRDSDSATAHTNVAIYQTSADGDTGLLMTGQYRDIVVATEGDLRFRERQLVYDTIRLPDSVVCPL